MKLLGKFRYVAARTGPARGWLTLVTISWRLVATFLGRGPHCTVTTGHPASLAIAI